MKAEEMRFLLRRFLVGILLVACLWMIWEYLAWPDVKGLRSANPRTTAFIEIYKNQEGNRREVSLQWIPYRTISPHLKRAVLAAEDINFFGHRGFALEEIRDALEKAVAEKEFPRGASTITQQLAKNLWLSPSRSPLRKLREALLTRQLEESLEKRRILEIYLNVVEFGPGIYGAEVAVKHYFNKSAADLSEAEAAQLAASLPRPSRWNPASDSSAYRRYVQLIIERMKQADWLKDVI